MSNTTTSSCDSSDLGKTVEIQNIAPENQVDDGQSPNDRKYAFLNEIMKNVESMKNRRLLSIFL